MTTVRICVIDWVPYHLGSVYKSLCQQLGTSHTKMFPKKKKSSKIPTLNAKLPEKEETACNTWIVKNLGMIG